MQCDYWDAGRCRSCALIETPYARQLADKDARARQALMERAPDVRWHPPCPSAESAFRNKAKMVVAGSAAAPTLGILDPVGEGIDLRECGLYPPVITQALEALAAFVARVGWEPYSVARRSGELKHVLVTAAADGALMVRFVARSTEAEARVRKHLGWLLRTLPHLRVVTLNVLPEHKAVLEGDREIVLTESDTLTMPLGEIELHLGPRAFFQTNTEVATALYAQVATWIDGAAPASLWDLYCGVGGFALHCAAPGRDVVGIEISAPAIAAAVRSRDEAATRGVPGMGSVSFAAADAVAWAGEQGSPPAAVIVNPPRRGLGPQLSSWLNDCGADTVVYSSCHLESLAKDLAAMPAYTVREARVFDMFPHTGHMEIAVLADRS
ncbi:methyltransferase domain-containing protein [Demequina globuliformis]|uniref:methyltransferase domain-containing protein n=1 Tax=Demequina globuliformis TaxID=676202 RepID=UPI0007860C58|nr:methyltransferase domain-containing protein [Demequina globuliformis]